MVCQPHWRITNAARGFVLVGASLMLACEHVEELSPGTRPTTLSPLGPSRLDLAPDTPLTLTVQARDEFQQPVDGTPVYFLRVHDGINFGSQPDRSLVTLRTGTTIVDDVLLPGVATATVSFSAESTSTEATIVAGLALPTESSLGFDGESAGAFFVVYRITNTDPADTGGGGGAGGTGGASDGGGGAAGGGGGGGRDGRGGGIPGMGGTGGNG